MIYILKRLLKEMLLTSACRPNWFFKRLSKNFSGVLLLCPQISYFIVKYLLKKILLPLVFGILQQQKSGKYQNPFKTCLLHVTWLHTVISLTWRPFFPWRMLFFPSLLPHIKTLGSRAFLYFCIETKQLSRLHICLCISTCIPCLFSLYKDLIYLTPLPCIKPLSKVQHMQNAAAHHLLPLTGSTDPHFLSESSQKSGHLDEFHILFQADIHLYSQMNSAAWELAKSSSSASKNTFPIPALRICLSPSPVTVLK